MFISVFFQWFGVAAFIGMLVMTYLVNKELKKQLPTEVEKAEMLERKFISESELNDKKQRQLVRSITADFRVLKKYENMKKASSNN